MIRRQFVRYSTAILGIVAVAVIWAGIYFHLSSERAQAEAAARQNASNLARAFEEDIVRSIKAIDQTLLYVRAAYAREPYRFDLVRWAAENQFFSDLTYQISIVDRSGWLVASSLDQSSKRVDLHDREHFRVHAESDEDELFISKPIVGRVSNRPAIQLTRRISGTDGAFAGVVVVSLDPQYLSRFYHAVDLGEYGSVTLVGTDGVVRARATHRDNTIGQSLASSRIMQEYARAASGNFHNVSPIDDVARLYAYREAKGLPLIVVVGLAEDEYLAAYHHNRTAYLVTGLLLTLLVSAARLQLFRHQRSLEATAAALRASEARFAHKSEVLAVTLENISQGIMMVDADRSVPVCNHRAMQLLGLPETLFGGEFSFDDILRWQWDSREFGQDGKDIAPSLKDFIEQGGISSEPQDYERTRPNGTVLEIRSIPLAGGGVVRTYSDVTDHKRHEQALRDARDEATRAARAQSDFLAMMSHEIRSPMTGVLGIVELLQDSPLTAEQQHMLQLVNDSAASLLQVLNDVLDYSKILAGAVTIVPGTIEIAPLLRSVSEPMAMNADKKGVVIEADIDPALPAWLTVDPHRLRQILVNLLSNALKFTAQGSVRLSARIAANSAGAKVIRIAVTDTGPGMSAELLARLFEPFIQADASITRTFGGTGLGLSISRRLARLLGGDLTVESTLGAGSCFTLELPATAADAPVDKPADAGPAAATQAFKGKRVLLVDDQATIRWLVQHQLQHFGIAVHAVDGGPSALAALGKQTFDLMITDCHMPGMDGVDLTARLRAAEAQSGREPLVVLGLTADVTADMRQRGDQAGMDAMETKPINLARLEAALRRLLLRHQTPAAAPAATATAPVEPVFDHSMLGELFEAGNPEGHAWLAGYLTTAAAAVDDIAAALASADHRNLREHAHRLAGSSYSVGARRLGQLARELEAAAEARDIVAATLLVDAVATAYVAARDAINSFMAKSMEPV